MPTAGRPRLAATIHQHFPDAETVAYYVDGDYAWAPAEQALFPRAVAVLPGRGARMRNGGGERVEQALLRIGGFWLTSHYQRTGAGWSARQGSSGITWIPLAPAPDVLK